MASTCVAVLLLSSFAVGFEENCNTNACATNKFDMDDSESLLQVQEQQIVRDQTCVATSQHQQRWNGTWSNTAFVTACAGKSAHEIGMRKCLGLAETVGRVGGWLGKVYIITDVFPDAKTQAMMQDPEIVGGAKVQFVKLNVVRNGVDFRQVNMGGGGGFPKAQLFNYPEIKEDVLVYHDGDGMITQTDCLVRALIDHPLDFGASYSILLGSNAQGGKCFKDEVHNRCGDGIHVGVFAAHRKWSAPIMTAWLERLQKEPSVWDRYSFYDAWLQDTPETRLEQLPTVWLDHIFDGTLDGCINHLTSPRMNANEDKILPFAKSMCLKSQTADKFKESYTTNLKWIHAKDGQILDDVMVVPKGSSVGTVNGKEMSVLRVPQDDS